MYHKESWTRFGPNGIGLSNHKTSYTSGSLIHNWLENTYGNDLRSKEARALHAFLTTQASMQDPSHYATISRESFAPVPKEYYEEVVFAAPQLVAAQEPTMSHSKLFTHGQEAQEYFATSYALQNGGGHMKPQDAIWTGHTTHDTKGPK
jgi:hypothetical protein